MPDKPTPADIYVGLRNQILRRPLASGQCAVLMDWPVNNAIATVMAAFDGTASVYLSSGGGFLGGGQKYASIRIAAQTVVEIAKELQPAMSCTEEFPLPDPTHIAFYVVTDNGVYTANVLEADLRNGSSPFTRLGNAAQQIVTQYRLSQQQAPPRTVQ